MFKCRDCGHLFEYGEEKHLSDEIGGCGFSQKITKSVCPICDGDYDEIKPCTVCGSHEHDADKLLCHNCEEQVKKEFANFACNLNEAQKQYLIELFENGEML